MGITDVFDPAVSDFTPMTEAVEDSSVTQATHAARVAVDEEGVTAAAFTAMAMGGSGMPPEDEVDFTLDRPFLFVLTSAAGQPLFAGVVNQPASYFIDICLPTNTSCPSRPPYRPPA